MTNNTMNTIYYQAIGVTYNYCEAYATDYLPCYKIQRFDKVSEIKSPQKCIEMLWNKWFFIIVWMIELTLATYMFTNCVGESEYIHAYM